MNVCDVLFRIKTLHHDIKQIHYISNQNYLVCNSKIYKEEAKALAIYIFIIEQECTGS